MTVLFVACAFYANRINVQRLSVHVASFP